MIKFCSDRLEGLVTSGTKDLFKPKLFKLNSLNTEFTTEQNFTITLNA